MSEHDGYGQRPGAGDGGGECGRPCERRAAAVLVLGTVLPSCRTPGPRWPPPATSTTEAEAPTADVVLVLGAQVAPGGTDPMPVLRGRLDTAAALVRDGRARVILVSGDGTGGSGDETTVMTSYLTRRRHRPGPRRGRPGRAGHLRQLPAGQGGVRRGPRPGRDAVLPPRPGGGAVPARRHRRRRGGGRLPDLPPGHPGPQRAARRTGLRQGGLGRADRPPSRRRVPAQHRRHRRPRPIPALPKIATTCHMSPPRPASQAATCGKLSRSWLNERR